MWTRDNSSPESEQKTGLATADIKGEMRGEPKKVMTDIGECDLNTVLEMYHYTNGTILELNGFIDDAIREYREAIHLNPQEGFYHYNLGVALLKNSEYNESFKELSEAIRLNPEDYEARCALGDVYCSIGRSLLAEGKYAEAGESFKEAVAIDQEYPDYHLGLGQARLEMIRSAGACCAEELLTAAIDEFRVALKLDPESKDARLSLGMALSLSTVVEKRAEGIMWLNEVLLSDPFNEDARSCIESLTVDTRTA